MTALARTRVINLRSSPYEVYCGRPRQGEPWDLGNPWGTAREGGTRALIIVKDKARAVERFAAWLRRDPDALAEVAAVAPELEPPTLEEVRDRLRGRTPLPLR
jgi:hypothetical protein